ncbi:MAG: 50S ribosomal protein L10 [Thermodesulfovibrionales bacterium]
MKRVEKEQLVAELKDEFHKAKALIFTDYRGLTVSELSEFRRILREGDIRYRVVKNTIAILASDNTPVSIAKEFFKGPVGIVIGYDDPVLAVKKVFEYSKKNEKLKINSGIIEGRLYRVDDIKTVAELPPKKVLQSMIAGLLTSPISKLASALNATLSKMVFAMEALKKKKVES